MAPSKRRGRSSRENMAPSNSRDKVSRENIPPSKAQIAKQYAIPTILVALGILWQLFVLPNVFSISHYDVIGVKSNSSSEEIIEAYERLTSQWQSNKDMEVVTEDMIEIQHAFEVLSDELRRRDYDLFDIDELQDIAKKAKTLYVGDKLSNLELPLLKTSKADPMNDNSKVLTSENFRSILGDGETWLIQVYSLGSANCQQFAHSWKRIVTWLDGVANAGKVELGEVPVAVHLAERNRVTGNPFFRYGLPCLVAFPTNCRHVDCLLRYSGELNVDAIIDWIATDVLGLPRILYYSPESLVMDVIRKPALHKVKVIFFSTTGQRAPPFIRQAARDYWEYASFAFALWREENATLWWNMFGVESAPAIVFLKDPGVEPVVHYGTINSSDFLSLMEQHKHHALPQLRSINSMDLGCDPRGYSRAGNGSFPWYCVIIAGKPGFNLNKMREILRSVQDNITNEVVTDTDNISDIPPMLVAAHAFKAKRLTLAWLDGVAQKKYCTFYLNSLNVTETCGPRRYAEEDDVPGLFLVRYMRNNSESNAKLEKRFKTVWDSLKEDVEDLASQLVAKYNGSMEASEILSWISNTIKQGDSKNLPYYRAQTPDLIPEESKPAWSGVTHKFASRTKRKTLERIRGFGSAIADHSRDPRIGPTLFLLAAVYMVSIRFWKNQPTQQNKQTNSVETDVHEPPPRSITDEIPPNAYQALETESDSE